MTFIYLSSRESELQLRLPTKLLPCHYQRPDLSAVIQELGSGSQSRISVTEESDLVPEYPLKTYVHFKQTQVALISRALQSGLELFGSSCLETSAVINLS